MESQVVIVADEIEAEVVCGLLRAEGIACGYRVSPGDVFGGGERILGPGSTGWRRRT